MPFSTRHDINHPRDDSGWGIGNGLIVRIVTQFGLFKILFVICIIRFRPPPQNIGGEWKFVHRTFI